MSDYLGFSPAALQALGRVVVSMSRCELLAAMHVFRHDPAIDPFELMEAAGKARREFAKLGTGSPQVAELSTRIDGLAGERNRLFHDVAGAKQLQTGGAMVPVMLSTKRGRAAHLEGVALPTTESINDLARRIGEAATAIWQLPGPQPGTAGQAPATV